MYLSSTEVNEVLMAATQIYRQFMFSTPQLANQNLKALSNNPKIPTQESIEKALCNKVYDSELLSAFSQFAEGWSMLYSRAVRYYANMLSYDIDWTCTTPNVDYNSKEYKEDVERVCKFLDRFNPKYEFDKATKEILRSGKWFTWFRTSDGKISKDGEIDLNDDTGNKTQQYTLQDMPQQYCMITGSWQNGFLWSFNMNYFTKAGVSLQSFDPIFRKYFKDNFDGDNTEPYNPVLPLSERDTNFALWQDVSPENGAWVFVADSKNANVAPPLAPLIKNILANDEMARLQKNANMLAAKGILYADLAMIDKAKSGQTQDQTALLPKTLTKFLTLVRTALDQSVNVAIVPGEGTKFAQFDGSHTSEIYSNSLVSTAGNAASASKLIFNRDKPGQFELEAQIETDYNFISKLYNQYENFLNYFVNKKTRNYKFAFHVSGCTYPFIRKQEEDSLMNLAQYGFVLSPTAYAKIVNMQPQEFLRSLKEGKETTTGLLSQLVSVYTQSGNSGRPKKSVSDRSESGNQNYE